MLVTWDSEARRLVFLHWLMTFFAVEARWTNEQQCKANGWQLCCPIFGSPRLIWCGEGALCNERWGTKQSRWNQRTILFSLFWTLLHGVVFLSWCNQRNFFWSFRSQSDRDGKWCWVRIKSVPLHWSEQNDVSDLTMLPDFAESHLSDSRCQIKDKNVVDRSAVWPQPATKSVFKTSDCFS